MVELMSRSVAFAEGVVTMVCPVLLALALKKDKWKSKVHDHPVADPVVMLVIAGAAVVTGICPLLACCISERFPRASQSWPSATASVAALLSSACLLILACWISLIIISTRIVISVGLLSGLFIMTRAAIYSPDAQSPVITGSVLGTMVDKSHEFVSGATGILFLGLEGMVLEDLIRAYGGTEDALRADITISFILTAFGVTLMYLAMNPPRTSATRTFIVYFTDLGMAIGTMAILASIMKKIADEHIWLLFLGSPVLIFFQLVYRVVVNFSTKPRRRLTQDRILPSNSFGSSSVAGGNPDPPAAPLGLTKVTFTAFLAVSVKAISSGSSDEWTVCFLLSAAAAIASGVSWRLLTHTQYKRIVGTQAADEAANVASFCTHLCVAVATVLFTVMAWQALSAKEHEIGA